MNRTCTLEEVRAELAKWKPAMALEVENLSNGTQAIERLWGDAARKRRHNNGRATVFPGVATCAKKPTKWRARAVVCGTFIDRNAGDSLTFTEQVDVTSLRVLLRQASMFGLTISSLDVSVAFLNAELSPDDLSRGICCRPPKIFVEAGVCHEDEIWVIKKALYGLRQAPRAWGTHRDAALPNCPSPAPTVRRFG